MSVNIAKTVEIKNSSQVKEVSLIEEGVGIIVTFAKGTRYLYQGVSEQMFEDLVKAESVGKYLNSNIKGKFEYVQLD